MKNLIISILFLLLLSTPVQAKHTWLPQLAWQYQSMSVTESNPSPDLQNPFFQENRESSRTSMGLDFAMDKQYIFKYGVFTALGLYGQMGKMRKHDSEPESFSSSAQNNFGLGIQLRIGLFWQKQYGIYIGGRLGPEYYRIDWTGQFPEQYTTSYNKYDSFSYQEKGTGLYRGFLGGIAYRPVFVPKLHLFMQYHYGLTYSKAVIEADIPGIIHEGNTYIQERKMILLGAGYVF